MKSKSKGFFHFGSRHSKDDSATVPQHHARKEKRNVGSSAGSNSLAQGGRKNGNAGGIAFIDDSQRQMNNHKEKCWRWEQSKRENVYEMIHELREADQNFWNHEFDEAIALYLSAIPIAREKLFHEDANVTVGEINVKISIILQGRGELQSAIDHLQKAKDIFTTAYNDAKSNDDDDDDDFFRIIMAEKIMEVTHGIANTFVEMGEKDEASKSHEDAIELCKKFFPKDVLRLSDALNNYANFLSICQNDHDGALERFKEALKILFQANHGLLNAQSAPTLTNMGKLYMRRTEPFQGVEVQKEAKKAEVCFARAVQLYRMSMMYNRNEKIAETLYNLMQAREWQAGKGKGILKNVRFDPQPIERQYTAADFLMSMEDDSRIEDEDDYDEDDYTYDSSTVATDQFMFDFDIFGCFSTTNKNIAISPSRNVEDKTGDIQNDAKQNKPVLLNDSKSDKVLQEQNSETLQDTEQGGDSKEKQLPSLNVDINCQDAHQQQQQEEKKKEEEREGEEIMQQQQPKLQDGTNPLVSVDYFLKL